MKRTRNRQLFDTEAKRLAGLGMSPPAIAAALGVNRSTVQRWMAAGHIADTRETRTGEDPVPDVQPPVAPLDADWAGAIRATYALDPTDAKLVALADLALTVAQDPATPPAVRLGAAGRFQSIVKQLARRIRPTADDHPATTAPAAQAATVRVDPRSLLNPTIQ